MRTEVKVERSMSPLEYGQWSLFMGSCFSEHIGGMLKERKFKIDLNPFGIQYNPVSIAAGIQRMISLNPYSAEDLFFHKGWWHSFDHHSNFSNSNIDDCLAQINTRLEVAGEYLKKSKNIFVTFGTARVYHQKSNGRVVSNCHQVPATQFENQLLRVGDIVRMYSLLIQEVSAINKNLKWIFTVSPVRHWKDGPHGNQVSKSTLILAVSELEEKFSNVGYFPAYEIFMDDLRDYRYYSDDLLHPGSQGIDYAWKKFIDSYLSTDAQGIMKSIESLILARKHRPRNSGSEEHAQFRERQYKIASELAERNPELDLEEFIGYFSPD